MRVDAKPEGPRQSMAWLHTWSSLILGWLLYAIFLTGSLSFFQNEISVWMKPELHQSLPPASQVTQVQTALNFLQQRAPDASAWQITLPSSRQTSTELNIRALGEDPRARRGGERISIDSQTGQVLEARETRGGSFLYRFHFELYGLPRLWTRWLVGVATMFMLVAIISGVITHKKIFKDFFTFRAGKGQRSWLDAHNATAVFALPFHFIITLSGLLLLMHMFMPWGAKSIYPEGRAGLFEAQQAQMRGEDPKALAQNPSEGRQERGGRQRSGTDGRGSRASEPEPIAHAPLTSIDPLVSYALQRWPENTIGSIHILHPNTVQSEIEIRASQSTSVLHRGIVPTLVFNGVTGELVSHEKPVHVSAPVGAFNAMTTLHEGRGLSLGLRWLLFISGVAGTLMVATGLVLWCVKRAPQQDKQGYKSFGFRLVECLNIAAIIGLPLAVAAYFYANRLIPVAVAERSLLEIKVFFYIWLFSLIYGIFRPARQAWLELIAITAFAFALLPVLNLVTGGRALWSSVYYQQWTVASFDLLCLFLAALLGFSFKKLKMHKGLKKPAKAAAQSKKAQVLNDTVEET